MDERAIFWNLLQNMFYYFQEYISQQKMTSRRVLIKIRVFKQ